MISLENITSKNVVVYDLEIKKTIEQCSRGWASHDEMGVSVGCMYDFLSNRFRVFMDDNLHELVHRLNVPDTLIVAFNHINFDNKLLRATPNKEGVLLKPDAELNNYDMFMVSKEAALGNANQLHKGFKLDDHLKALGMPVKTGDGAQAPIWWQEGKTGKVVDYCLNDVRVETNLFVHICLKGFLCCAYNPDPYSVRKPVIPGLND